MYVPLLTPSPAKTSASQPQPQYICAENIYQYKTVTVYTQALKIAKRAPQTTDIEWIHQG